MLTGRAAQVEKLRAQVAAQEAARAETEAEVAARRAAAQTLKERERALQQEAAAAQAQAEALNAAQSATVLAVSQARLKVDHLEQQLAQLQEAAEALAALAPGAPAQHRHLALQPAFEPQHLAQLVRGATPSDALVRIRGCGQRRAFPASPFRFHRRLVVVQTKNKESN